MPRIEDLTQTLLPIPKPKLEASGVGVWIVWEDQIPSIVFQIFHDFGGFLLREEDEQALWFFFDDDAFKALARLSGFARVSRMPLFIETFPAALLVSEQFDISLSCSEDLQTQSIDPVEDLEMWAHPGLVPMLEAMPGVSVKPAQSKPGMSPGDYWQLTTEISLGQSSPLGWYYMLRPLGDPLDKNTAEGWRSIFSELQALLEHFAVKHLSHEGYLIFGLDTVRDLQIITRELLLLEKNIRAEEGGRKYWPCVMACVMKKGHHFNKDLPRRIKLDWEHLSPDYPHMSFKSALYLGTDFRVNDVRRATGGPVIDDWCHISLATEEEEGEGKGQVPFKLPPNLLAGGNTICFYCGLSNHSPRECPTKLIPDVNDEVWDDISIVDIAKLEQEGMNLNQELEGAGAAALGRIMEGQNIRGLLLRAVFEICYSCQLRFLDRMWRSKGKQLPDGIYDLHAPDDGEYLWNAIDMVRRLDDEGFENEINQGLAKLERGFQPRTIQGFHAMEQGDWSRAAYFWQEAARNAYSPLQHGWLLYLEARAMEVQGEYHKALALYRQAKTECPKWMEPIYRQGVCLVKMGFTDQGLFYLMDPLLSNPNVFNRILLDPELERGRVHIMAALWKPWCEALATRDDKALPLKTLPEYLKSWFRPDHPFLKESLIRAQSLMELALINNYVSFHRVVRDYDKLQRDLHQTVEKENAKLNEKLKLVHDELKSIHEEAAWFPFGKLLREFNKDFNSCATKVNWMRTTSLQVAANFRKSQDFIDEIESAITLLKARLVTLRIIRDSTLFILLLGRSFMWLELAGLVLTLVAVPVVIYFSQKTGQLWLAGLLEHQKWQVQKGLLLIVSIAAMAIAAINTAVGFEKRRAKMFKQMEEKANKRAKARSKGKAKAVKAAPAAKSLPAGKGGAVPAKPGGGKPAAAKGKGKS